MNMEDLSLDEIGDILKDVEDADSTYNFQEIKCAVNYDFNEIFEINCDDIEAEVAESSNSVQNKYAIGNLNKDEGIQNDSSVVLEQISETVISELHREENAIEIIKDEEIRNDSNDVVGQISGTVILELQEKDTAKDSIEEDPKIVPNDNEKAFETPQIIKSDNEKSESLDITENNDVISIFSETESDCGYHSSDFEFITEEEAKMDGFITNFNAKRRFSDTKAKHLARNEHSSNNVEGNYFYGAGPSSRNQGSFDRYKMDRNEDVDESIENDEVPQGNDFLELFRGYNPALPLCEIHFLEIKSLRTRTPMLVQYEGIGFDMNLAMQRQRMEIDNEFRDEADETRRKILEMYPEMNTRKRRRNH